MKLSVITPTFNKKRLLMRTLESLSRQTFPGDSFEVLVIDDGSTDGTREFLDQVSTPFTLRPVLLEANRGRAAARNRGLEQAAGELVVFLDDDMELVEEFLEAHHGFHQDRDNVAGIGNVINHPEVTEAPIDRYMSTRGAQKIKSRGRLPWRYFSTNNASVPREYLTAVGGFDETFRHYGFEDLELAYRLEKERGVALWFVEGARSLHIHPHTLEEVLSKKTLVGRSSMPYLFSKYPQAQREMGFDRFLPVEDDHGESTGLKFRRSLYRALLNPVLYHLVKPLARVPLGEVTYKAIDYLVLYHYLEGMKRPLASGENP